jgi:flavodoxin
LKTIVLYKSLCHGNTLKIATVIAETLKADIKTLEAKDRERVQEYELIGFGSGIFYQKHHKTLFDFVEGLPEIKNKQAFVFSTSGLCLPEFNTPLETVLKKKGFQITGSFVCKGWDTWGPYKLVGGIAKGRPDESDLQLAREFASSLPLK